MSSITDRNIQNLWKLVNQNFQQLRTGLGILAFPDGTVSCQNPLGLSARKRGRYDLQIVLKAPKNGSSNAAIQLPQTEVSARFLANANAYED